MTTSIYKTGSALLLASTLFTAGSGTAAHAQSAELIEAAKAEGELNVIALPHDWCGWGEILDAFKEKYGLKINELDPEAGSADEIDAIRAAGEAAKMPDVIDVGLSFGPLAKEEGLIQPYKVENWDAIPDSAKDPDGFWNGGYYGVLIFQTNADVVSDPPQDWQDLLDPDYAKSVALAGDPRSSNQAILSVYAAGLSAGKQDPAAIAEAGLQFFASLNKSGNLVPVIGTAASLAQGATPIVIRWDHTALADRDMFQGNPDAQTTLPNSGVVAGVYAQAINAKAANPNAARLWLEYIHSDEGQVGFLKGYCHPIRFNDLVEKGKVPPELLDRLAPAEAYSRAVFPSAEDQQVARKIITEKWDSVVGADIR